MNPGSELGCAGRSRAIGRQAILLLLALLALPSTGAALPRRLIIAVDGIAYRDMKALQEGVTYQDLKGRQFHRQAFHRGYFPASRMVSTFPSASDVAWTEILGNRPLPGYQRTYYSIAENAMVAINCLTTSVEYERQMTWETTGGVRRGMGYVFPRTAFKIEVHDLISAFWNAKPADTNFYAFIRATDDAQHLSADIFALLCRLDAKLEQLRAQYRQRERRELEIVILSDHGNNHAGPAKRVEVRDFLKKAGYRITQSIRGPKDVVLPTAGIESWVEIHNDPAEAATLASLLAHLPGADIVTARIPQDAPRERPVPASLEKHAGGDAGAPGVRGQGEQPEFHAVEANRFLVLDSTGARAVIEQHPTRNAFRYLPQTGDPIDYQPVVDALARKHLLDADGFATAEAWMAETLTHRYPLAPERIARGLTRVTLNPATILISLKNDYIHADWLIKTGSDIVRFGGTHGALDDLNSVGMVVSSYAPTPDTSSSRVAALFDGFAGLRDFRATERGAEWICGREQSLTRIVRGAMDCVGGDQPANNILLRVWAPDFTQAGLEAPLDVTIKQIPRYLTGSIRHSDPRPPKPAEHRFTLDPLISAPGSRTYERTYALPADLVLEPQKTYSISGRIPRSRLFSFSFHTDVQGRPIPY